MLKLDKSRRSNNVSIKESKRAEYSAMLLDVSAHASEDEINIMD
jgi:hypothetical protein